MSKRKPKIETCNHAGAKWHYDTVLCEWHTKHIVPTYVTTQGHGVVDSVDCARCKCWEARDER